MIPGVKRVCIKCGTLTLDGSYCNDCSLAAERIRSRQRGTRHYTGDYRKRAAEVRANAVECWLCHEGAKADDPWTADHVVPGKVDSPLLPAHRSCNSRRGNRPSMIE